MNGLAGKHLAPGKGRNVTRAFELFQSAASTGSLDGYYNLAGIYRTGGYNLTVFRDTYRQVDVYDQHRNDGGEEDIPCGSIVVDYSRPAGPNIPLAVYYYAKAAEHGHFQALQVLGSEYARHNGWLSIYAAAQRRQSYERNCTWQFGGIVAAGSSNESQRCVGGGGGGVVIVLRRPDEDHLDADERVGLGFSVELHNGFVVADVETDSIAFEQGLRSGSVITHVEGEAVATVDGYTSRAHGRKVFTIHATPPSVEVGRTNSVQQKQQQQRPAGLEEAEAEVEAFECLRPPPTRLNNPLLPTSHHPVDWPTVLSVGTGRSGRRVVLPLRPSCEVAAYYLSRAARMGHVGTIMDRAMDELVESGIAEGYSLSPATATVASVRSSMSTDGQHHHQQQQAQLLLRAHETDAERRAHELFEAGAMVGFANGLLNGGWLFARAAARAQLTAQSHNKASWWASLSRVVGTDGGRDGGRGPASTIEEGESFNANLDGKMSPQQVDAVVGTSDIDSALLHMLQRRSLGLVVRTPAGSPGVFSDSEASPLGADGDDDALLMEALTRWLRAAELGSHDAMNWLGYVLATGTVHVPGIRTAPVHFAADLIAHAGETAIRWATATDDDDDDTESAEAHISQPVATTTTALSLIHI